MGFHQIVSFFFFFIICFLLSRFFFLLFFWSFYQCFIFRLFINWDINFSFFFRFFDWRRRFTKRLFNLSTFLWLLMGLSWLRFRLRLMLRNFAIFFIFIRLISWTLWLRRALIGRRLFWIFFSHKSSDRFFGLRAGRVGNWLSFNSRCSWPFLPFVIWLRNRLSNNLIFSQKRLSFFSRLPFCALSDEIYHKEDGYDTKCDDDNDDEKVVVIIGRWRRRGLHIT